MTGDQPPAGPPAAPRAAPGVDRKMLESLICPATHSVLEFDAASQELVSRQAGLAFPIRDGIPIMLIDEARRIED